MAKPANQNRSWLFQTVGKHPPIARLSDGTVLVPGDKIRVDDQIKTITTIYPGSYRRVLNLRSPFQGDLI
jgi:hypothetical protein